MVFWEPLDDQGTVADYFKFKMLWDEGADDNSQLSRFTYKRQADVNGKRGDVPDMAI